MASEMKTKNTRAVMVGNCILGHVVGEKKSRKNWALPAQRLAEVERIIRARHGAFCDTDDAVSYVVDVARAVANDQRSRASRGGRDLDRKAIREAVVAALSHWLPVINPDEVENEIDEAVDAFQRDRADAVARRLGVTMAERQNLGLKTIGAKDLTRRERNSLAEARKVERKRERRRQAGDIPREQFISSSVSEIARSWGVSRKTLYQWRKSGDPRGFAMKGYTCDPYIDHHIMGSHLLPPVMSAKAQPPVKAAMGPNAGSLVAASRFGRGPGAPRFTDIAKSTRDAYAAIEHAARCGPSVVDNLMRTTAAAVIAFRRVG